MHKTFIMQCGNQCISSPASLVAAQSAERIQFSTWVSAVQTMAQETELEKGPGNENEGSLTHKQELEDQKQSVVPLKSEKDDGKCWKVQF